jgi:hypothetical protein
VIKCHVRFRRIEYSDRSSDEKHNNIVIGSLESDLIESEAKSVRMNRQKPKQSIIQETQGNFLRFLVECKVRSLVVVLCVKWTKNSDKQARYSQREGTKKFPNKQSE